MFGMLKHVTRRSLLVVAAGLCVVLSPVHAPAQDATTRGESELAEARRLFEALDYEHAAPALDRAIAIIEPMVTPQPSLRSSLISAYEMRARTRFGLGDRDGTVNDLKALITLDPSFAFAGQVSPRVVALLEEVRKSTLGSLVLTVDPPDAAIELDGQPFMPSAAAAPLAAAEYTVKASRVGYKPIEEKVVVTAGETKQVGLAMERSAAVVFLVTSPPDVEVVVDGTSRGRTAAGSLPVQYADVPGQLGVAPEAVSTPLVLTDLMPGAHTVQFRRSCHTSEERRLVVENLADYRVDPVLLKRAVASVNVESTPPGATVFVDGEPRGTAPAALDDLCEGTRVVELRSPQGRFVKRIDAKAGDQISVQGTMRPAFALIPAGAGVPTTGVADARTIVERALASSQQIAVFVPAARDSDAALSAVTMPPEWLAFDAARRPFGGAAVVPVGARRELSASLARGLDVQGVAAVTQPSPQSTELTVTLLAAGADVPDVVTVVPERADSINVAVARFDYVPPLSRVTIGALVAELTEGNVVIVAQVDQGQPADRAGLRAGDMLLKADGQPTASPGVFQRVLDGHATGQELSLEVMDRSGATRTVAVQTAAIPRLISVADQTLLFNPLSVALKSRLAAADPSEQWIIRLNLGIALMRLGDNAGAKEQFEAVPPLADGPGITEGTRQYLLGLANEGLGDGAAAQKAWQAAVASEAWLTEDGPAVKALAQRKLGTVSAAVQP
jgi:tetratricopeptide (TPR) repeat protein